MLALVVRYPLLKHVTLDTHDYLLPCEAVFGGYAQSQGQAARREGDLSIAQWIEKIRTDDYYRETSSSRYGPVPDPFDYPAPRERDVNAIAARRFGPYFDTAIAPPAGNAIRKTAGKTRSR